MKTYNGVCKIIKIIFKKFLESSPEKRRLFFVKYISSTLCSYKGVIFFFSPEFFPSTLPEKFLKFNKTIRNIFRGIFLQRKFPQGNFSEFVEIKQMFTAVNLYFLSM